MSKDVRLNWTLKRHQEYLGRQAAREQRHQEYLERQAAREQRHQEYLERQAARDVRQQEYLDRIQENTSHYRARYDSVLTDLVQQGLEEYLPTEFALVRSKLAELDDLLDSDPEQAREVSMELGPEVSRLPAMARAAQCEFEVREKQRQQELAAMRSKATSDLAQYLHTLVAEIRDPIERDFAFDKLKSVQSEYAGRVIEVKDLPRMKDELRQRVQVIRSEASVQAQAWKERKAQETLGESQQMLIDIHREQAESETDRNPMAMQVMLDSLEAMRSQVVNRKCSMADIQSQLSEAGKKADDAVTDENCRRMVVRSILESLQQAGFVVATPQRKTEGTDEVVILARKPAGAEALFRVTADGGMSYKFDHYEGMKCKADIDQVLPMLQEIYGIELSNERILWQNPDRISKSAKPIDDGYKEKHHG